MDFGFIVFILTALLFILLSVFTFTATSKHENRFFHNHIRQTFYAAFGCEAILIILTILDLSGAAELGGYSGLTAWCAGFGAVILYYGYKKKAAAEIRRYPEFFSPFTDGLSYSGAVRFQFQFGSSFRRKLSGYGAAR